MQYFIFIFYKSFDLSSLNYYYYLVPIIRLSQDCFIFNPLLSLNPALLLWKSPRQNFKDTVLLRKFQDEVKGGMSIIETCCQSNARLEEGGANYTIHYTTQTYIYYIMNDYDMLRNTFRETHLIPFLYIIFNLKVVFELCGKT